MKVLLIDPPHKLFPGLRMWTPSFGLLQLGAYLEREGTKVQIVDATALSAPWKDLGNTVSTSKADVIGITCSATCLSPEAIQTISLCRKLSPNSVIVAGGSHFTLMAETILRELKELNYIILGEGEITFSQLIQELSRGGPGKGLKGLAYSDNGKVIIHERRSLIPNLDSLPFPAYHLIDMKATAYYWHGMGRRAFGISTSRGCGDHCTYCSETKFWESVWRGRSGKRVVEEWFISINDMVKVSLSSTRTPSTGVGSGWKSFLKSWGNQVSVSISGFSPELKIFFEMKISSLR
jgi:radical SAM superfamily enzyme YgiQ (UPF0313 family)